MSSTPPAPDHARLRALIEQACQARQFQQAYDTFRQNFGEAHRHPDLCFFTGVALFELGKPALALQYFQSAAVAANALDWNLGFWQARAHQQLGELDTAVRFAELAWRQMPLEPAFFDLVKDLRRRLGRPVPAHWVMIGCSHARYFRYLQLHRDKFFGERVQLEVYEFGGATAYGLGHAEARSGVLEATRKLRPRIAAADRVLVYFGEIDCRRAAWKAAQASGRPVEDMIAESSARLRQYVERELLPHNRAVLVIGAKPQIVADDDFYKNSLEDERTVFKPLAERERITLLFNAQARAAAASLGLPYADIDHVLADEGSRRQFFERAFWDRFTSDTHGNIDYFAGLYHQRLQEFV